MIPDSEGYRAVIKGLMKMTDGSVTLLQRAPLVSIPALNSSYNVT